jgi:hypothetical protein
MGFSHQKRGAALRSTLGRLTAALLGCVIGCMEGTPQALANDLFRPMAGTTCSDFVLTCENGRDYPFCPRAVSSLGDVVTGTLMTGTHHGVHMRLIPMGVGYRYAGKGIWFDGYQSAAALNFGKYNVVACTITKAMSQTGL